MSNSHATSVSFFIKVRKKTERNFVQYHRLMRTIYCPINTNRLKNINKSPIKFMDEREQIHV